jgi:P4 family phage/plasmid primase-like protien
MNKEEIKDRLRGQWEPVLLALSAIPQEALNKQHQPCPKCGGNKRFNFERKKGDGGIFCNDCKPEGTGDGFGTLEWFNGWSFAQAIREVEQHIDPDKASGLPANIRKLRHDVYTRVLTSNRSKLSSAHEADLLARGLNTDEIVNRGYASIGASATIAIAAIPEEERKPIADNVPGVFPGGALRFAASNCLLIPVRDEFGNIIAMQYRPNEIRPGSPKYRWLSSRTKKNESDRPSPGAPVHFAMAPKGKWIDGQVIRITEGPLKADVATAISGIQTIAVAGVNVWRAAASVIESAKPKMVLIAFDMDRYTNAGVAKATVELYEHLAKQFDVRIEKWEAEHKGVDDALARGVEIAVLSADETREEIDKLRLVSKKKDDGTIKEAIDDPHRLAAVNLQNYEASHRGKLVFWRDEWWKWKDGKYRKIELSDLKGKVCNSIRREFVDQWMKVRDGSVKKVTRSLVHNVVGAMESMCLLPASIEMSTCISTRKQPHWVSMTNGILDLEAVFKNQPLSECVLDHTPDWFSSVSLNYEFNQNAKCPLWDDYLDFSMSGDQERIDLLQEWAGYLLTSENHLQRFLVLEGEGSNGKTVFFAGMTAMLGQENVSNVPIENFSGRFDLSTTLGKAANIAGDVGEVETLAEGVLKQFTGGDVMMFDRKNKQPISARPTAKLMCSWNIRPHIRDRSNGLWRRMLIVPFDRAIPESRKVYGMDNAQWWVDQNEVAGILMWAIVGLDRLRQQGTFTEPRASRRAIQEYKEESNSALRFLNGHVCKFPEEKIQEEIQKPESQQAGIKVDELYKKYLEWCAEEHVKIFNKNNFGKEVKRKFGDVKVRSSDGFDRFFNYRLIAYKSDLDDESGILS